MIRRFVLIDISTGSICWCGWANDPLYASELALMHSDLAEAAASDYAEVGDPTHAGPGHRVYEVPRALAGCEPDCEDWDNQRVAARFTRHLTLVAVVSVTRRQP